MPCEDCQKQAQRQAIIGAAGGLLAGAGLCFVILRYVVK